MQHAATLSPFARFLAWLLRLAALMALAFAVRDGPPLVIADQRNQFVFALRYASQLAHWYAVLNGWPLACHARGLHTYGLAT